MNFSGLTHKFPGFLSVSHEEDWGVSIESVFLIKESQALQEF